jgi:hypothetical protein
MSVGFTMVIKELFIYFLLPPDDIGGCFNLFSQHSLISSLMDLTSSSNLVIIVVFMSSTFPFNSAILVDVLFS